MTAALSFPKVIHMGDTGIAGLRVQSTKESLEIEVNPSYHLIVETRLDLPLMEVTPDSGVEQTFDQTRPLNFQWTFFSNKSGKYEGQLWVYILIVNREGEIDRQAMLAVPIELDSHNFLGLSERILLWVSVLLVPTLLGVGLYYRKIE